MDPKSRNGSSSSDHMMLAPGVSSGVSSYGFPSAERRPTPAPVAFEPNSPALPTFPRVDEHLVQPEISREEVIRGRRIQTMGANPPHADAQVRADFVIAPHVCEGYVAAADLLTRASETSNFATDVSIRKEGTDPNTGARYLEELSFEIVNEQSMRDVTDKAEDLIRRGVRRVFAIFVKNGEICEWSPKKNEFVAMNKQALFEDPLFIRPIAVQALVDATLAEAEVVRALEKKGSPEIGRIRREGEDRGHKKGFDEGHKKGLDEGHKKGLDEGHKKGRRDFLLDLLHKRFGNVPLSVEERVRKAQDDQIDLWAEKLFQASSIDDLFTSSCTPP